MRQLVIALAVVLTGAYAWAQNDFVEGHAQGDGVRLAFRQAGAGPLIVFLHGHPDDWTLYTAQLREFSRDHLVVAPNLRGYPPSEAPSAVEAYTMPHLLNDLHALLEHVGRERCVLVGNDWGGYVAWVFASAYPDRVERLVILNAPHPAIHLRNVRTDPEQNRASQYERDNNAALPPYPVWYNYYRADPIKTPATLAEAAVTEAPDLAAHFFAGVAKSPATTSLQVRVPTLVMWGMRDPSNAPSQLNGLEAYVPHMRVVRIEDAGHYPMRSHPTLVNQTIREFLRDGDK
jgi:pimeloyl-ACP methyl ester carboxylesterase